MNNNVSYVVIYAKVNDSDTTQNNGKFTYIINDGKVEKIYNKKEVVIYTTSELYNYQESLLQATYLGDKYNYPFIITEDSYLERYRYNTLTQEHIITKHPITVSTDLITYATTVNAENLIFPANQNELWKVYGNGSSKPTNGELIGIDNSSYINLSYVILDNVKFLVNEEDTDLILTENN